MGRHGFGHDELSLSYLAGATEWGAVRLRAPKTTSREPERTSDLRERDSSSIFRIAPIAGQSGQARRRRSRYGVVAATRNQRRSLARIGRVNNPAKVARTEPQLNGRIARRSTQPLSLTASLVLSTRLSPNVANLALFSVNLYLSQALER
jgi:hypothetical protein